MKSFIKKIAIVIVLICVANVTFADRGTGKKSKMRTLLNINTNTTNLKASIFTNIKSGLVYRGSLVTTRQTNNNTIINSSLMTYQKGNTTYIIPYKNKIAIPEIRQGYTGVKLIIRSNK